MSQRIPIHALPFSQLDKTVKKPKRNYPETPITFGEQLRKARMDKGLLQKDVAKIIGVTECCITFWEKGRSHPLKRYDEKLAAFLKLK